MKKILITGGNGMLAHDFYKFFSDTYELFPFSSKELDITDIKNIEEKIQEIQPDVILNCAAYTKVDNAEDVGMKQNYDVNTLGVHNLAKITKKYSIDFITISTDYVFDGKNKNGYSEGDIQNPINQYGMAKYLGECLARQENNSSIIVRTSWLYGGGKNYKNFVNTMIHLGKKLDTLKVVNDQFGIPTNCKDLSIAIGELIGSIEKYKGKVFHFSNESEKQMSWYDFAKEIFEIAKIEVNLIPCNSGEFPTKAKRPNYSILNNNSDITLRNWKEGLNEYLI